MQSLPTRIFLVLLALGGLAIGGWATFLPSSFYTDFPGIRRGYVSLDGPFNEHLIRDVGAMFLALAVVAIGATVMRSLAAARLAGAAWLVFSVPHLVYHVTHLHVFEPLDQWINAVGLSVFTLLPLLVLLWPGRAKN
jgi:hypothetical protein